MVNKKHEGRGLGLGAGTWGGSNAFYAVVIADTDLACGGAGHGAGAGEEDGWWTEDDGDEDFKMTQGYNDGEGLGMGWCKPGGQGIG